MALTVDDRRIRPLTADEVMRMAAAGILGEDERVELLHGALTEKPVKTPAHEEVKARVIDWLRPGWDTLGYVLRIETPLTVRDRLSLPEPDIAVVEPRDYSARHPTTALLVIEIAVSSLTTDTRIKPQLFAAADVLEMWVVDVPGRRLHVFTDAATGGYQTTVVHEAGASVTPTHVDAPPLVLDALFAGL